MHKETASKRVLTSSEVMKMHRYDINSESHILYISLHQWYIVILQELR